MLNKANVYNFDQTTNFYTKYLNYRGSRTLEISQPITYSPQSEIAWNTNTKLKEDKSLGNVSLNSIVMRGFD